MINQTPALKFTLLCCFLAINSHSAIAQITPDNTLGAESSQVVPNGSIDRIDGGALRSRNLFHSFKEFNINNGQSVYFSNPSGIENILTRVTGGNVSNILGTLGVDGAANLFLINPNGIIFGENARLDINGSFVGSTANGLQFGEQGTFSATNPEAPGLLTVNPNALFFNQINQNAEIINNSIAAAEIDASGIARRGLRVADGKDLLLVGGNVSMDRGGLNAPGGKIELGGLAEAGIVELQQEGNVFNLIFPSQLQRTDVLLKNDADINVVSTGGGSIVVNARNLNMSGGSSIATGVVSGGANSKAGNIEINATERVKIDGVNSTTVGTGIVSGVLGSGSAGDITINTGSLDITGNGQIGSASNGEGDAGNVIIKAKDNVSISGINSGIVSTLAFLGVGDGANIDIQAQNVLLDNSAQISTGTLGTGNSGNIKIDVDDSLFVNGGSVIVAGSFGQGNAGTVTIEAGNTVSFDGVGNNVFSGAFTLVGPFFTPETEFTGDRLGGDITITTESLSLTNGARLNASTNGQGNAGNIFVQANGDLILENDALIAAETFSPDGKGGNINIEVGKLIGNNGGQVSTSSGRQFQEGNFGRAGDLVITATESIELDGVGNVNRTGFFSETSSPNRAGDLTVNTNKLTVQNGAGISSGASGSGSLGGDGGNLVINATESIDLIGFRSALVSEANGLGNAGDITIATNRLSVKDEALISAFVVSGENTTNQVTIGNGGNIDITVDSMEVANGGQIIAATFGEGFAGNITINAFDDISFDGGTASSRVGETGIGNGLERSKVWL